MGVLSDKLASSALRNVVTGRGDVPRAPGLTRPPGAEKEVESFFQIDNILELLASVDRAGITAGRGIKSLQPARQLSHVFGVEDAGSRREE